MKFCAGLLLIAALAVSAAAQRPRVIDNGADPNSARTAPAAPLITKAKYEGGVPIYRKKQDGFLVFEDTNHRLVFKNKQQKELLFIPYSAVNQIYADTQSRRPTAASVVSAIPVPYGLNFPARFIKKKYRYLTVQFYDDDSQIGGLTSFKVDSKEVAESLVITLAKKAGLVQRGEIYARMRRTDPDMSVQGRTSTSSGIVVPVDGGVTRPAVFIENEMLSSRVISLPRPTVPEEAKDSKISGVVRVLVTVDERGRVAEAEAVSGPTIYQAAAIDAARQALFEPIIREGKPVTTKAVIAYSFVGT